MIRYESLDHASEAELLWHAAQYTRCLELLALEPANASRYLLAARCFERLRRHDKALAVLAEGAQYLSGGEELLEAAAIAAVCCAAQGDVDTSRTYLRVLESANSPRVSLRVRVEMHLARAACAWMREDLIESDALIASCPPSNDPNLVARARFFRSWIRWSRGKTTEQAALLTEALGILSRAEMPDVGLMARCAFALAAVAREHYLPHCAAAVADAIETIPWTSDLQMERFQTLRLSAWSQALQAGYIPAIRQLHEAREAAPSPYFEVLSRFDRAWVSRIAGERASFEAEALGAAELALSLDWTVPAGEEATALLVGAELLSGIDTVLAEALLARYEKAREHVSPAMAVRHDPKLVALTALSAASIASARNDVNGVRRNAKTAFDIYDGLGVTWRAAWCALLLYRSGCGDEWLAIARANVKDYPRSFMATELARIDAQRGRVKTGDLTARQREIFDLLMDGLSIDDVADKLICSRNTVRIHVGAIYKKFGVRNRIELLTQTPA